VERREQELTPVATTTPLTPELFGRLFDGFRQSAYRLEALQQYLVPEEAEDLDRFLNGQGRIERSVRTSSWLRQLAETTLAGRRWHRVHLVRHGDHGLSNYMRFELLGLLGNIACGDDIRVAVLDEQPGLEVLEGRDYWLFDGDSKDAVAALMRYDAEGRFLGADQSTDPEVLDWCRTQRDAALAVSISLHEYLARYRPVLAPQSDSLTVSA
jgi:hypothetical protein